MCRLEGTTVHTHRPFILCLSLLADSWFGRRRHSRTELRNATCKAKPQSVSEKHNQNAVIIYMTSGRLSIPYCLKHKKYSVKQNFTLSDLCGLTGV